MKSIVRITLLGIIVFISSCLKDENVRKYTFYVPQFATSQEVQDNVKMQPARAIENMGNIVLYQNYMLAVEHTKGIHVMDVSNPAAPVKIGFIPIPGNQNMAIRNNYLYADCYMDLFVIDISNMQDIHVVNVKQDIFKGQRYVMGYELDQNNIIVDWEERDTLVTESQLPGNGRAWNTGGIFFESFYSGTSGSGAGGNSTGGSMARFTLVNDHMYVVDAYNLFAFDLTSPLNPNLTSTQNVGWNIETIYPFKDNLFIGSSSGMFIYSIVSPSSPSYVSAFSHANACDPVIANDKYAFVTLRSGTACDGFTNQMEVLDVQNLQSPLLLKTYPFTNPHGLGMNGNTMFLCDGRDGLRVLDATDVNNIDEKRRFKIGLATDVIVTKNLAYVNTPENIFIYEFTSYNDVKQVGSISK